MSDAYPALHYGAAWLDLSGRGKIAVIGPDSARLLHAMTTNHVEQLTPNKGCYAFFLSAQGRILADVNILCLAEQFLLDTEPEISEKVFQHLDKFIIADDVLIEDRTLGTATLAIEGPQAAAILAHIGAPVPEAAWASAPWDQGLVARLNYTGGQGFFLFTPTNEKQSLIERIETAGAVAATPEDFETVRIERGKPRYGVDISERFLAQETNQGHALSFQKGCYLGQEIVERVRSRGQIHRLLMPLEIDTDVPPVAGTKLQADGKDVAEITSAALSPTLGKVAALAYVRVEHSKPGTVLSLDAGMRAEVRAPA